MKLSRLLKALVLLVTAGAIAAPPPPKPAAPPAPAHHSPLADRLARSEASVKALDRHLAAAAEVKASQAANSKLAERAKKLARRHDRAPLAWTEYVRHIPGEVVIDNSGDAATEQEAEKGAAALGNDLDALWARRKQVEAERMILWAKIAFRAVADMELSDHPLYRFELKSAGKPLDEQRMEALKAAAQFVRVVDHLAGQAQDAVDVDPQMVFEQWHKLLADARLGMQDKMLLQALVALDVYKPDTEAGQLTADAKKLTGLAQTIVDAERAMMAADAAGDDEEADASRAQFQQALADTAGAVEALDHGVAKAATAWGVTFVPGTKATVTGLPDIGGGGPVAAPQASAPAPVSATPVPEPVRPVVDPSRQNAILFISGDDHYELYINGEFALKGGGDVVPHRVKLGVGDVITVQARGKKFEGFACLVAFPEIHKCIVTDAQRWKAYTPTNQVKWYEVAGISNLNPVVIGSPQEGKAESHVIRPHMGALMTNDLKVIWGPAKNCFLMLKIAPDIFQELKVALPPT